MIKNYIKDGFGVIHQLKHDRYLYNVDYVTRNLGPLGEKLTQMSHLRLGYITGSIGRVPYSVLDVGYGDGAFLKACRSIINNCYGNDISTYPVPMHCLFIENILDVRVDVITFFDSLEHFEDISFLADLQCNYVSISVPWCHYYSDEWFKQWKHRKPDEHLKHFSKDALIAIFDHYGFSLINTCGIEDVIRKGDANNILTATFKKRQ